MAWNSPNRVIDIKAVIGGVEYLKKDIVHVKVSEKLCNGQGIVLGSVTSARLDIKVKEKGEIPKNAKVVVYSREGSGEWVCLGTYYVDDRDEYKGYVSLICYDILYVTDRLYRNNLSVTEQPLYASPYVYKDIVGQLGLENRKVDEVSGQGQWVTVLNEPSPSTTMRNMLTDIAMVNYCCMKMNRDEELIEWISFRESRFKTVRYGEYSELSYSDEVQAYDNVILNLGEDSERVEGVRNPKTAIQVNIDVKYYMIADQLVREGWKSLVGANGYRYKPFNMVWRGDPSLRTGDRIRIELEDGSFIESFVLECDSDYSGGFVQRVRASIPSNIDGEFGRFELIRSSRHMWNKLKVVDSNSKYSELRYRNEGSSQESNKDTRIRMNDKKTSIRFDDKNGYDLQDSGMYSVINGERVRHPNIYIKSGKPLLEVGNVGDLWVEVDMVEEVDIPNECDCIGDSFCEICGEPGESNDSVIGGESPDSPIGEGV